MSRQPRGLIAGNWKMNGLRKNSLREFNKVAERFGRLQRPKCDLLICPPATLIGYLAAALNRSRVRLGAQDCHALPAGAHTGDLSAEMLADVGCSYVIVGHSERRKDHGETDREVKAKAEAVHRAKMTAIVCVGETKGERRKNQTLDVIGKQLRGSLSKLCTAENTVIAYEPVWAIGTGLTPTADDVADVHAFIRRRLQGRFGEAGVAMRLLYGGSVKASNAAELLHVPNVDGALVGGASLTAKDLWPIVRTRC